MEDNMEDNREDNREDNGEDDSLITLDAENELQVRVGDESENVGLKLVNGLAEIFGSEMEVDKVYMFPPSTSIAVFTWQGCSIKIIGTPAEKRVVNETILILHVVLHAVLEEMRQKAESENNKGPVILVVGPNDSGKSTLCQILLNYAARLGRRPFYVDLDVGQNSLSIPGTINVLKVKEAADIVDGFEQDSIQVFQFGYKSPGHFIALYFLLIKKVARVLKNYLTLTTNSNARHSGIVINTCGWTRGQGYNAITLAALSFKIDKLAVLEDENLCKQLKKDMPSCVEVLFIPKMDGVIERSRSIRYQNREKRVKDYFYGSSIPLQPYSFEVKFSDVEVYKVVSMRDIDDEAVTVDVSLRDIRYTSVPLGPHLLNQVLALSSADEVSKDMVLTNAIGFICITDVDMDREIIKVLSPQPEPLPKKYLILGDIELNNTTE